MLLGLALVLAGVFMPHGWYDALPRSQELASPPIEGITLLQISLVAEGLMLAAVYFLGWKFVSLPRAHRVVLAMADDIKDGLDQRLTLGLLTAITLLALALRLVNLGSDLWLDEIISVVVYGPMSLLQVIGGYINFNNHLLNTLLMKLAIGVFGEHEWAIRLPVALLGTATIPAVYWVSRQLRFSRGISLGIALLLAVSYQHIFFSQNARGYIGLVFFSLVASGLLIKALQTDRLQMWVLYVVAMFLNFASLLTSAYVLAAHMLVGAIVLFLIYRRGQPLAPMFRRLAVVFGLTGFLAFQLYALILPYAFVRAQAKYTSDGGYFSLFSTDLLAELLREVSAGIGIGTGPLALAVLVLGAAIAGIGFVVLLRRSWALTLALSLPGVLSLAFLVINGLTFSPRFFLPALPVGLMAAVQGVYTIGEMVGRQVVERYRPLAPRFATAALVLLVLAVSLSSLRYYYSTPKQAYRASIKYVESERTNGEPVIVVDLAEQGYRYYGDLMGTRKDHDYYFVQSQEELDSVLSTHPNEQSLVVTTLPRFLRARKPELDAQIQQEWEVIRSFPGTIGDGQISVWAPKPTITSPACVGCGSSAGR